MASILPSTRRWFGTGLPYVPLDDCAGKLIVVEGTDGVGRSTQTALLREWLQIQGFSVVETGWTRSKLLGPLITEAKQGHSLNRLTFALMYAADFADRLENEIIPALRAGSIVLSDRYIYTAFARDTVRGVSPDYVRKLFGFALVPDLTFYLKIDIETLVPRVLRARRLNYWEAGVDLGLGWDLYDCFVKYQTRLLATYDDMEREFGFATLDARQPPDQIQKAMRREIEKRLFATRKRSHERDGRAGGDAAEGAGAAGAAAGDGAAPIA
ncbi:MAG: dTMP kinase [Candidatus Brocadiae bacterium]|nr:dTMP kinase [Candidatus Brocadiia bacterium]